MYPVIWRDADGRAHNTWLRNHFTNELSPDPDGEPLYTTVSPEVQSDATDGLPGGGHA